MSYERFQLSRNVKTDTKFHKKQRAKFGLGGAVNKHDNPNQNTTNGGKQQEVAGDGPGVGSTFPAALLHRLHNRHPHQQWHPGTADTRTPDHSCYSRLQ